VKPSSFDEASIRRALALLDRHPDDIPVAALVLDEDLREIASAVNRRAGGTDPTAHAEILALRSAGAERGSWRLDGCTLVVTLEPCPMCAGAAVSARLSRIVFGAWNPDYGSCGSLFDIPRDRRLPHRVEVVGGVLADECGAAVSDYLASRRTRPQSGR
jgi:tRNA(adenine34) deaminase